MLSTPAEDREAPKIIEENIFSAHVQGDFFNMTVLFRDLYIRGAELLNSNVYLADTFLRYQKHTAMFNKSPKYF